MFIYIVVKCSKPHLRGVGEYPTGQRKTVNPDPENGDTGTNF